MNTNELRAVEIELRNAIGQCHCGNADVDCDSETCESARCDYHVLLTKLLHEAIERITAVRILENVRVQEAMRSALASTSTTITTLLAKLEQEETTK